MRSSKLVPPALAAALCAILLSGCDGAWSGDPAEAYPQFSTGGPKLLECPATAGAAYAARVGVDGAVLDGAGVRVIIPAGALLEDTEFTVAVPASPYLEIDVTANGLEHFRFAAPVTVTIDYSRCTRTPPPQLSVWHIDGATRTLLENMGGVDDRAHRRITFTTVHLSGYAIAN